MISLPSQRRTLVPTIKTSNDVDIPTAQIAELIQEGPKPKMRLVGETKTWPEAFESRGALLPAANRVDVPFTSELELRGYVWTRTLYAHPPKGEVFRSGEDLVSVHEYMSGRRLVLPSKYIPESSIGVEGVALVVDPERLEYSGNSAIVHPKSVAVLKNAIQVSGPGKIDIETGVPVIIAPGENPPIDQERRFFVDEENYDLTPIARYNYGHESGDVVALYWGDRVIGTDYRADDSNQQVTSYHPSASLSKDEARKLRNLTREVVSKAGELARAVKTLAQKATGAPRLTPTEKTLMWVDAIELESESRRLPSAKEADAPAMTQEDLNGTVWTRTLYAHPPRNGVFKQGVDIVSLNPAHDDKRLVMPARYVPQEAIGRAGVALVIDPERLEYDDGAITVIPRSVDVLEDAVQRSGQAGAIDDETGVPVAPKRAGTIRDGASRRFLLDDSNYNLVPIARYFYDGRRDIVDASSWPSREIGVAYVEQPRQLSIDDIESLVADPTEKVNELLRTVDTLATRLEGKSSNGNGEKQKSNGLVSG